MNTRTLRFGAIALLSSLALAGCAGGSEPVAGAAGGLICSTCTGAWPGAATASAGTAGSAASAA